MMYRRQERLIVNRLSLDCPDLAIFDIEISHNIVTPFIRKRIRLLSLNLHVCPLLIYRVHLLFIRKAVIVSRSNEISIICIHS